MSGLKATAQSKALKLTWKKNSSISGYEIQYSTSKNFASAKTFKISKSKTSYTIKKLKGSKKYYVQSALTVADEEKREQEVRSLNRVGDSFKKIVVIKDTVIPWHDDNGILYIGIEQFLLDETAMDM